MATVTPRTLSGFMELLPAPQQQMERMMEILRTTYSRYGFTPLDTPAIEARNWARAAAAFSRLPELVKESRRLRREVDRLSALLEQTAQSHGEKK